MERKAPHGYFPDNCSETRGGFFDNAKQEKDFLKTNPGNYLKKKYIVKSISRFRSFFL